MNVSESTLRSLYATEPKAIAAYLDGNGWEKRGDYKGLASIWSLTTSAREFTILLPHSSDLTGYENRLYEILLILEKVENRPGSEIVESLRSSSQVAREMQREIVSIRLQSHYEEKQHEIPAKHLADILKHTQEVFDAIGQVEAGRASPYGQIQREITERTKLSVVNTFKGSFGLRLSNVPPSSEQLNWLEEPLFTRSAKKFLKLLNTSDLNKRQELVDLLFALQQRATSRYRKLLLSLIEAGKNFSVEWASTEPENCGSALLPFESLADLVDLIEEIDTELPEEYEVIGTLISVAVESGQFTLKEIGEQNRYSGRISEDLLARSQEEFEFKLPRKYYARIREVNSVSPATGERKTEYTLLDLRPYP